MAPEPPVPTGHSFAFPVQVLDIRSGSLEVFLHPDDAGHIGVHPMDRVRVRCEKRDRDAPALVNIAPAFVTKGVLGLSVELATRLGAVTADKVGLRRVERPRSVDFIRGKLDGRRLSDDEVTAVISDIARGDLTTIELTAWAAGIHVYGMDLDETVACIRAMVSTGDCITFERGPVVDVHSIGGVPGNKYAPIAVSIVAANGILIPKTSSRAISSACGTADFIEVVAPVAHSAKRVKQITEATGGSLVWGGGVSLAPADDEIIRVEYPLSLDPPSQLLASVLSKKIAVGATKVLIDIPTGAGAKVPNTSAARHLARDFIAVGERVGLEVQCMLSQGDQPLGNTIGPILEMREALQVLEGATEPAALVEKACTLAGRLLEMGDAAEPGQGVEKARETLQNGRALETFRAIVAAQGGDPGVRAVGLRPGQYSKAMKAPHDGPVVSVDNKALVRIARAAGSPQDKGAGLVLHVRPGMEVRTDQPLYTIHAESESRLAEAVMVARQQKPYQVAAGGIYGFVE